MFTLLVTSGFMPVTTAVVVGISPSMAPSAALLAPLTVRSTCEPARTTIFTVTAILKVTVITSTRERCEWDSGLEVALASRMLMPTRVGLRCPGFSLKRCQKLSNKHVTRDQLDSLELKHNKDKETARVFINGLKTCMSWEIKYRNIIKYSCLIFNQEFLNNLLGNFQLGLNKTYMHGPLATSTLLSQWQLQRY